MALNGIDISSYQSSLNLSAITFDFVLIKATEGLHYVNPFCNHHYQQAKAAGKRRAVYHFIDFNQDMVAQANFFVDNCRGYIHDAIFVLDWEGPGVANTAGALRFLHQVEARIGYKPAIYMSQFVENSYDWTAVVKNNNGLWAAKYSDYEIDNNYDMSHAGQPPILKHWPFYFMWQWTSKGHLRGYAGDLDCDIFYGSVGTWDAYAGVPKPAPAVPHPTPPPAPAPAPVPVAVPIAVPPGAPVTVPVSVTGSPVLSSSDTLPLPVTVINLPRPNRYARLIQLLSNLLASLAHKLKLK